MIQELGVETTQFVLGSFSCPRNLDVENFLREKSIRFEQSLNSRTYLIFDEHTEHILAYFALTFKQIHIDHAMMSKTKIKSIDGMSKNAKFINAFLIGQIGKNKNVKHNSICLKFILDEIYSVLFEAQKIVGGRIVILECEDEQNLITKNQKHGFELIELESDIQSNLKTMYYNISNLVKCKN